MLSPQTHWTDQERPGTLLEPFAQARCLLSHLDPSLRNWNGGSLWGSQGHPKRSRELHHVLLPSMIGGLPNATVSSAGRAHIPSTSLPLSAIRRAKWGPWANSGTLTPLGGLAPSVPACPPGQLAPFPRFCALPSASVLPSGESALPCCHLADSPAPALPHPVVVTQPKLTSNQRPEGLRKLVTG